MRNLQGKRKRRRYFEGFYLKQQNDEETVALIPAFHTNDAGVASASLQVITGSENHHLAFEAYSFFADRKRFLVRLENCIFSPYGCKLAVKSAECSLSGTLRFGSLSPPAYDIMGPFSLVPWMECRHSVFSLFHRVDGELTINDKPYVFENSSGYMEGDRGTSFPSRYIWTQCSAQENSIMLSIAEIPFGGFSFVGCVGFVYWQGKEHRIGTYCGVKLLHVSEDAVLLRQGKLLLKIKSLHVGGHLLRAPHMGNMTRTIHENVSCPVQYTCSVDGKVLFDFVSEQASFESNWRTT